MRHWIVGLAAAVMLACVVEAEAAVDPGEPGDSVVDLMLDMDDDTLMLSTESVTISGFVLRSSTGIFDGDPADLAGWWFTEDTDTSISGNMGRTVLGEYLLGAVIGPDWKIIDPYGPGVDPSGTIEVNPYDDLTFTYTVASQPGSFYGNLIVSGGTTTGADIPEPSTLVIWALGVLGLAWYGRRRRK